MSNRKNRLGFETLEGKRLLACDVAFDGETLDISCDDAGDLLLISEQAGDLVVGFQNLGSAANLTDININSRGGGDAILMSNLNVAGNIDIKTGGDEVADDDTDDVVIFTNLNVGGDLDIKTGEGADFIFFQGANNVAGTLDIKLQEGNDTVFSLFGGITANDIKLKGQDGTDTINGVNNLVAVDEFDAQSFEIII